MYLKATGKGFHTKPSPTLGSLPAGLNYYKLVTRKAKCSRKSDHRFDLQQCIFVVLTACAVSPLLPLLFARLLSPARWLARQLISECGAGKRVRPISCEQTDMHILLFYGYRFTTARPGPSDRPSTQRSSERLPLKTKQQQMIAPRHDHMYPP